MTRSKNLVIQACKTKGRRKCSSWCSQKHCISLKKKVSSCEEFLCFERLSIGKMFECSLLSFGTIAQHLSLHILLAVAAEELLVFLQLTIEIAMLKALKSVRHTRNADVGQPGHLCLLFVNLALSRALWKASWFPCACRMHI